LTALDPQKNQRTVHKNSPTGHAFLQGSAHAVRHRVTDGS